MPSMRSEVVRLCSECRHNGERLQLSCWMCCTVSNIKKEGPLFRLVLSTLSIHVELKKRLKNPEMSRAFKPTRRTVEALP
ncbi:hypothetical protein K443DRAFT_678498 [Laccaria amethystina LaAM-08-1]|uniref:Uncharacterized protein n=1 Tax=Laccaria amethystina LaAM-08-1 TaxID=1095629 RepID=A0A0C9XUL8_9AGAR|nr:hypothetical protein K443DRAFT_678498 [Laccaria amethystina LaAM-08-1]